jgi:hypothetical protein
MDKTAPPEGWILYSPAVGEYLLVEPRLEDLAVALDGMIARTRSKYPDAPIHCWELGRKMEVGLGVVVRRLEPIARAKEGDDEL